MRVFCIFLAFAFLIGTAKAADPLETLPKEQRDAIFQLYTGFSDGLICKKLADVEVASAYLKLKLGDVKITSDQIAHYAFDILVIHTHRIMEIMQKGRPEKVIPEHCKVADQLYGPAGSSIPGLLKELPPQKK